MLPDRTTISQTSSSPAAGLVGVLDLAHLSQMTMGDDTLEREVLQLFDRQAEILLDRMASASPNIAAALAHTLKGSARGVGAWRVAQAAEAVEQAIAASGSPHSTIAALAVVTKEVRTDIACILRTKHREIG